MTVYGRCQLQFENLLRSIASLTVSEQTRGMKTIKIAMDEELLAKLDRDQETQRDGRSVVLCRAAAEYLKRSRHRDIAARYQQAYGKSPGLGSEFKGWEDEGGWPSE